MGQQQLLLLLVGVIVVGLMITVGIIMFGDEAAAANRDALANDLALFASTAQQYSLKPRVLGGGDGSMVGFRLPGTGRNANGSFNLATTTSSSITIEGIGVEKGYDAIHPVKVAIVVTRDSIHVSEIN